MSEITDRAAHINRQAWDSIRRQRDEGVIPVHHDVAADILAGKTCLYAEQRLFAGDVAGKRLLDLGCGDGCELLEWVHAAAQVVGVDNSPRQIAAAQRAAQALGLSCELIVSDLLHLPEPLLRGKFDLVFSSIVTAWIGDLNAWFRNVYLALKPGGIFLLSGDHPLTRFTSEIQQGDTTRDSYFVEGPFLFGPEVSPEWNPAGDPTSTMQWYYTLGSLLTAVAQAGLHLTHVLEADDPQKQDTLPGYPALFHLRATKEKEVCG
jgi:SAM-dependent methyltransferase